jgi:predicted transcriptional regulator of viral defense system
MDNQNQLDAILTRNKGVLRTSAATAAGVSRVALGNFVSKWGLKRVARGVYLAPDAWEDGLLLFQMRFPKSVYSDETALYLLGLAEREPVRYTVTVPANHNTSGIRKSGADVCRAKEEWFPLGIEMATTPAGSPVRAYNAERTICDLLRHRNRVDGQDLQSALRAYARRPGRDIPRLMRFADLLGVARILRPYLEALL